MEEGMTRAKKKEHLADSMDPIVFEDDSAIRDALLAVDKGSNRLQLIEYKSEQNRRILIEHIEDQIDLADKNGEDLWVLLAPEVQGYHNTCLDAIDEGQELPDFPDRKVKEVPVPVKTSRRGGKASEKKKTSGTRNKKVSPTPESVKDAKEDRVPINELSPGTSIEMEGSSYLCVAETVSNYILESSEGVVLVLLKADLSKKDPISRDPEKLVNAKSAGRKNVTHLATELICENPDMSLEQVVELITKVKHLPISPETIRVKFTTIQEIRDWEDKVSEK